MITMDNTPLFSIVIPSYNCAQYIRQTLRSIYLQTVTDYEIIIVNDGSPDNLLEVLSGETDPRLRIITQPNGGVSRARNRGIREAKGRYIAFLDSDDVWLPFHLEKAKIFFEKYPQYHWYATTIEYANDIHDDDFAGQKPNDNHYYLSNWFLEFAPIPLASSTVVKCKYAEEYLHFPEGMKMYEDNVAWAKFAHHVGALGSFCSSTAIYRQRSDSATQAFLKEQVGAAEVITRKDLILQQELLLKFSDAPESVLYYRKRAIYSWIQYVSEMRVFPWKQEIEKRKYISGRFVTLIMCIYAYIVHIATALTRKVLMRQLSKIQKRITVELKSVRRKLD